MSCRGSQRATAEPRNGSIPPRRWRVRGSCCAAKISRALAIDACTVRMVREMLQSPAPVQEKEHPVKQYLLSIYQPEEAIPPSATLASIMRDVNALRQEMKAAGVWVFSGGLHPAGTATVIRPRERDVLITDGPYI